MHKKRPAKPATQSAPQSATRPPLSVEDLWALDRLGTAPTLSPDGRWAVASVSRSDLARNSTSSRLWLFSTAAGGPPPRPLTRCGDKDGQPAWSPAAANGAQLAFVARREQEGSKDATPQLYLIDVAGGGEARRISDFAPGIESFRWLPDGKRIVFSAWVWPGLRGAAAQSRRYRAEQSDLGKSSAYASSEAFYRHWDHQIPQCRVLHLLLLDLASGRIRDLFEGRGLELPREASGRDVYAPSPDGRHIAFVHDPAAVPLQGNRLALSELELGGARRLRRLVDEEGWDIGAPCYRPDGAAIAVTAAEVGRRHTALAKLALVDCRPKSGATFAAKTGASWRLLPEDAALDLHLEPLLRWRADGQALFFMAQQRGRCHLWRQDLASGARRIVQRGGWVQGFDLAGERLVSVSDSALHPLRLQALSVDAVAESADGGAEGGAALRLDRFNDALLARRSLGEVRELSIRGALGDPVQLWLTLPPGFDARRKHALLQIIHGGPFAAAGDTFSQRWNAHVLAARGHVVAQLNYHGSSGFGFAFRDSIMGRQGELELQDIEAASDWLLQQPWADARRLSAAGGSYGGFLVAWMNGHVAPGRYRSYVCHAGVFDRIATFSADSYPERPRDLGARYWEDRARVLSQSPASFAAAMQTPTLVIHGALDYRVPDCNGLAYYNTLKARGIEARLLWFPDENHWVLKPANSRLWYRELLDWVQAREATRPAPAPGRRRQGGGLAAPRVPAG